MLQHLLVAELFVQPMTALGFSKIMAPISHKRSLYQFYRSILINLCSILTLYKTFGAVALTQCQNIDQPLKLLEAKLPF